MLRLPPALAPLSAYKQFFVRKTVKKPGTNKTDKIPISPTTLRACDGLNPVNWLSAEQALASAAMLGPDHGVSFALTEADPFFFLDIDGEVSPEGLPSPLAASLLAQVPGAAIETSVSGRGLHAIGRVTNPGLHACKPASTLKAAQGGLDIELYTSARAIALTGVNTSGDVGTDCTSGFNALVSQYFPPRGLAANPTDWTDSPVEGYSGPADDKALIDKALKSKSGVAAKAFGKGCTFADLWHAEPDALGRAYPDAHGGRAYDASSADSALAHRLAFWTGKDCDRTERLMRESALYRDKWDQHITYLKNTVLHAVSETTETYSTKTPKNIDSKTPDAAELSTRETDQYLSVEQQKEHFKDCAYVTDMHRVFTPGGALLRPEQFRAKYGGYIFVLDSANEKTTNNAWEAFTESQGTHFPKVDTAEFRPDLAPGALFEDEGLRHVNLYTPAVVARHKGDPKLFLDHLAKILPIPRDREILLAYMAACVQHPGIKFQWAPLLQGTPGNGKTLFTRCVAKAVGRKYCAFPKAKEIGNKFNGFMYRKLFVGLEDVYYPETKAEIIEDLKPLITSDYIDIELKRVDAASQFVCANFMLNSNFLDAVRKTADDRRFCIFYTAQQSKTDMERDGMTGTYFPTLYRWLKKQGGYAIVAEYLYNHTIPDELNPATQCQWAPDNSSTDAVLRMSAGRVEQEILEAAEEGRYGFSGGWVSSLELGRLLDNMRKGNAIPPNKRRELMRSLGYDWHPGLQDGRLRRRLPVEQGKPRLYIKNDHIHAQLTDHGAILDAYETAQRNAATNCEPVVFPAIDNSGQ